MSVTLTCLQTLKFNTGHQKQNKLI